MTKHRHVTVVLVNNAHACLTGIYLRHSARTPFS
jgi:hypothetical protein